MKRAIAICAVGAGLVAALATSVLSARTTCGEAVTLEGRVAPANGELRQWLEARASQLLERPALLVIDGRALPRTFAELGIELDLDATERAFGAELAAHAGCTQLSELKRRFARTPEPSATVTPQWRFDADRARRLLGALAAEIAIEPVDARLDLRRHERIDARSGRELDLETTLADIERGARDEGVAFALHTRELAPNVTSEALANVDVSLVLSAFETDFSRFDRARIPNIRRAAELLNGTVVGAGEILSFNQTVGPRLEERGFKKAPVIVADVTETGVGGGVCQVASTLHAAARYGGLEVVSRRSHSRPSGYAPLGLDAVVLDGEVDLKLKNSYPTPLIVHAFLPTKTTLRVELLGREAPRRVTHGFTVEEKEDFERLVLLRRDYDATRIKKHQKGTQGYKGYSVVRVEERDGTVNVRRYESRYYPAPEVFWVGSAVQSSELPELSESVTRVQFGEFGVPRVTE